MTSSQAVPFTRSYNPSTDELAIIHICQQTLPTVLKSGPAWDIGPYIWAVPYGRLTPDFCFVLDDGTGTAVGYIIGTPSLSVFLKNYDSSFLSSFKTEPVDLSQPLMVPRAKWGEDLKTCLLQIVWDPAGAGDLAHLDFPGVLGEYPAHLHIDLLPAFQAKGWGQKLMERFWGRLKEVGVDGVHLVMAGDNFRAEKFYVKLGFERYPFVIDGGLSGEKGKHGNGNLWMVRKI